jgi:hypothetical protein
MIKILITGDFCPHKRIEQLVLDNRFEEIYNDFLPNLENNDINITNLECPLINHKSPILKIGPNLLAKEKCIEALLFGKFNLLTLSNNHILDQGRQGLLSTIELCNNNNIENIGAGTSLAEASKILIKQIKKKRIAFLNFSENEFSTASFDHTGSNPLNPIQNFYAIRSVREQSDYVIVIVHGGHEEYPFPSPRMVETYRFFINAGADIVIGHHPHCYSGYEKYQKGYIFYSLGNFIFDMNGYRNSDWNFGYAVKFYFDDQEISFDIIPYKQCDIKPGVFLLNDNEITKFYSKLNVLNKIIINNDLLKQEWNKLVMQRKKYYLVNFETFNSLFYKSLRYRSLLPGMLSKKKKLLFLNMISCEAHRDLVIDILKL